MRKTYLAALLVLLVGAASVRAQQDYLRTNPQLTALFADAIRPASLATVRVQCDGNDACLGVSVGSDGWILTKAHDLQGKLTCKFADGQSLDAKLVGVHEAHDLAMLKVAANLQNIVTFSKSDVVRAGSWVASAGFGKEPAAIGVVSVATRKVREAYLGVQVEATPQGVLITHVLKDGAADKAGVQPKDVVILVDREKVENVDQFQDVLGEHLPGDVVAFMVRRGATTLTLKVTLQSRDQNIGFRAEFQNRLGSDLSTRRGGYAVILQHDSIVRPSDCGGALVDLKGRVVGINISRAGRVESWAIPGETVQPLLGELKSGRLAPRQK
jgi:serine protease Do